MESKPSEVTKGLTVGAILVSAITTGFTGLATIIAQAVAILAFVAFLTLLVIHRQEWLLWLREVRGQRKLLPLIGMAVFALGFIACFTWWSLLPRAPSPSAKRMISFEMADAQAESDVGHALLQEKLKDAAATEPVVTPPPKRIPAPHAVPSLQPASPPRSDVQAARTAERVELLRRRTLVLSIDADWSRDGVPDSLSGRLDQATDHINSELKRFGETWAFDKTTRRRIGLPPPVGESYEPDQQ